MTDGLSAEDYDSVSDAMRSVGRTSLNGLIEEWQRLVEQVEQGYAWTRYEYVDELECRTAIASAWPILTERVDISGSLSSRRSTTGSWPLRMRGTMSTRLSGGLHDSHD